MIWREVPEWPRYEVSNTGLVRSRDMSVNARNGATAVRKGRVLQAAMKTNGYWAVTLTNGPDRCQISVHRLVASVFHGPPPYDNAQVLHFDGDKNNNAASNLRWGTAADNHEDTERHGRRLKGERNHNAKLTEAAVRHIRASKNTSKELAEMFGVTREHVWAVQSNRVWRHIN
jgi:hypothetical protein